MKLFCYENPLKTCHVEENPYLCFWYVFPFPLWMGRCDYINNIGVYSYNDIPPTIKMKQSFFPFRLLYGPLMVLLASMAITSCGDDDPAPLRPQLPATSGSNVRTITRQGSVESGYDWKFTYQGGRLTQAAGTLRDPSAAIDHSFSYTSRLTFRSRSVEMKNSTDEKVALQLNAQGLVQQMTVNRNIYRFSYNDSGRLAAWDKTVFEESLGLVQQYHSSATIGYTPTGALKQITYNGTDSRKVILTIEGSSQNNQNGLIPPTLSREMGCIGFEHLFYAGLLGKAPSTLVESVTYEYPDAVPAVPTVTTTFEYGFHLGNVALCNYHLSDGSVASVAYGY